MTNKHPGYRADIDGLRAIAILSVIIYHAFPRWLPGGFVGVDIFFVISGYLISGIIIGGIQQGRFSFADFYARRVKRIFPALALVLLACLAFSWLAFLSGRVFTGTNTLVGKHAAAGAAFIANLVYWRESGYFDADVTLKPLVHLWSLGVEEQFYIVWPPLLILAHRLRLSLAGTIIVLAIASFALNVALVASNPTAAFYLPFTRFWELLAGALLAWRNLRGGLDAPASPKFANALSAIGLGCCAAAMVLIDKSRAFPGWWALLPVTSATLMVAAGPQAAINRRLLASPPMVFFGKISYPLYLWHWPLLSFAWIMGDGMPGFPVRVALVLTAILLAWLTTRFVEGPVRFSPLHSRRKVQALCGLMGLLVVAGVFGWQKSADLNLSSRQSYAAYFDNTDLGFARRHDLARLYRLDCDFYDVFDKSVKPAINPACYTPGPGRNVFLWGDSHAQALNLGLKEALPPDATLLQITTSGCSPALHDQQPDNLAACNKSNRFTLQHIAAARPDLVIIAQRFNHEQTDWTALAAELQKHGAKKVLLLGPLPQWQPDLWKVVLRDYWPQVPARIATHRDNAIVATDAALRQRYGSAAPPLTFASLIGQLCNAEGCVAYTEAGPEQGLLCFDYGHLTPAGSRYIGRTVLAPLLKTLLPALRSSAIRPAPAA